MAGCSAFISVSNRGRGTVFGEQEGLSMFSSAGLCDKILSSIKSRLPIANGKKRLDLHTCSDSCSRRVLNGGLAGSYSSPPVSRCDRGGKSTTCGEAGSYSTAFDIGMGELDGMRTSSTGVGSSDDMCSANSEEFCLLGRKSVGEMLSSGDSVSTGEMPTNSGIGAVSHWIGEIEARDLLSGDGNLGIWKDSPLILQALR